MELETSVRIRPVRPSFKRGKFDSWLLRARASHYGISVHV